MQFEFEINLNKIKIFLMILDQIYFF